MNNIEHGSTIKKIPAQGVRGNCTRCLQDPCSCVSKDVLTSYRGVVYRTKTTRNSKRKRKTEKAHNAIANNGVSMF